LTQKDKSKEGMIKKKLKKKKDMGYILIMESLNQHRRSNHFHSIMKSQMYQLKITTIQEFGASCQQV
jgi:hypothetical protein